jgi:hypothetical protein
MDVYRGLFFLNNPLKNVRKSVDKRIKMVYNNITGLRQSKTKKGVTTWGNKY